MFDFSSGESVRSMDAEGRLHISMTPISKGNVCPYYGVEIPRWRELGLDPNRVYQMYRDPVELERAKDSSNNIQLLIIHEGVTADDPKKHLVVGTTGDRAVFEHPHLKNSMAVWDADAIRGIEDNTRRQLSSSYGYVADMTPGSADGVRFDGRMTSIHFNHVALVKTGRAGADVWVDDALPPGLTMDDEDLSQLSGDTLMPGETRFIAKTSLRASVAKGALAVFLSPRLANDAAIDYRSLVDGVTAKNWRTAKPLIVQRTQKATAGKLAKDASLDGLILALDEVDEVDDEAEEVMDEEAEDRAAHDRACDAIRVRGMDSVASETRDEMEARHKTEDEACRTADKKARDAGPEALRAHQREGEAIDEMVKRHAEEGAAMDKKMGGRDRAMDTVTKAAMDSAIQLTAQETEERVRAAMRTEQRELREAEELVRPVVGPVVAMDSAEAVYRFLFTNQGVDTTDVPPAAFKALATQVVKGATARVSTRTPTHANDAAAATDFSTRFPELARVRRA